MRQAQRLIDEYANSNSSDFAEGEDEEGGGVLLSATTARAVTMADGGASLGEVAQGMDTKMEDTVESRSMSEAEGDQLSDGEVEDLLVELEGQTVGITLPIR